MFFAVDNNFPYVSLIFLLDIVLVSFSFFKFLTQVFSHKKQHKTNISKFLHLSEIQKNLF